MKPHLSMALQVIGQSKGTPFAVPISYTFEGGTVAGALDLEVQRADYIRKHQIARGEPVQGLKHLRSVAVNCGMYGASNSSYQLIIRHEC